MFEALPDQRRRLHRAGFHQADPRHPETALLHGDAARLAQQLAPLPDANDGRVDAAEHRLNAAQAGDTLLLQAVTRDIASHAAVADDVSGRVEQRQRIAVEPANTARRVLQVQHQVAPAALFRDSALQ